MTLVFLVSSAANADDKVGYYGLGKVPSEAEIAGWDIDVRPDGMGLPPGQGSVEDGEMLYEEQCAECHGSFGEGVGRFPVLAGGQGSLSEDRPTRTVGSYWPYVSTLWDYIHRAMPFTTPESLEDDEVYAITAYVLYLNDLVEDDFMLTQANLASIEMPNQQSFFRDDRPDVENVRCMNNCKNPDDIRIASSVALEIVDSESASEETAAAATNMVYEQYCSICHKNGVAGAPILGDVAGWQDRIAKGLTSMTERAISGFTGDNGVMPAKGGFLHLSDADIGEAVKYMMESSQ